MKRCLIATAVFFIVYIVFLILGKNGIMVNTYTSIIVAISGILFLASLISTIFKLVLRLKNKRILRNTS